MASGIGPREPRPGPPVRGAKDSLNAASASTPRCANVSAMRVVSSMSCSSRTTKFTRPRASARSARCPLDTLNVNGGSIVVGQPFGMTGARMITTLINSLQFHEKHCGLFTMCIVGRQGMALIIERVD